ncbi:MAG: MFS transporter [Alphaproteobacteria bacterium]|nr:MFS transporter [Alphaproteobacteria bacterium]
MLDTPKKTSGSWLAQARAAFAPAEEGAAVTSNEGRKRAFFLLFCCLIANGVGQTLMFAILPPLAKDLGISEFQVGSIFAVSATVWVLSSPFWGRRSDLWGRRPIILIGLAAFGVSTFAFASVLGIGLARWTVPAVTFVLLILTRCIYGLFGSGTYPAAQAYIADRTTYAERTEAIAGLNAAFGLGQAVGPGIGAALIVLGATAPLYFVALLGFASACVIWLLLPERSAPHQRRELPKLRWNDSRVLPFIVFGIAMGTVGAIPIQTIGFLIGDLLKTSVGDTTQMTGVGLMASSIASLFAQFVLVQRFKLTTRFLMRAGTIVALCSNLLFLVAPNYGLIVFALVLSGLGFGMVRPGYAAAASLSVPPEEQGAVAGLTGAAGASGFIFAPLIGNALYGIDPHAPYMLGAVLMAALAAYALMSRRFHNIVTMPTEEVESALPPN